MTRIGNEPNVSQRQIGNPPPQIQAGDKVHTVRSGDNLTHIARDNKIPLRDLLQANPQIQDPNRIWPGDQVRIPGGSPQPQPATTPTQTTRPNQNNTYTTNDPTAQSTPTIQQRPTSPTTQTTPTSPAPSNSPSSQPGFGPHAYAESDNRGGGDVRFGLHHQTTEGGGSIDVAAVRLGGSAEISDRRIHGSVRADGTVLGASTGNTHTVDVGGKLLDAGGEATFHIERDGSEGRIGAGYRANIAEVSGGVGSVSNRSTEDFRQEVRVSAGVPSGGAFVSWNDRDGDGARNYRLDIDVPIPGTPLGVGVSYETEKPVQDGLGVLGLMNPITAPIAGGYLLGRALKFW